MIISHKYRFIFIKTVKTAGTSIEVYLSGLCGSDDIITPFGVEEQGHEPRNHRGRFNPIPEMAASSVFKRFRKYPSRVLRHWKRTALDEIRRNRFYNHIPAYLIRSRVSSDIWNGYFKFCVERNPWDKTLSHYWFVRGKSGIPLSLDSYLNQGYKCFNYPRYTAFDNRNEIIVDRVLKYEDLNNQLADVFGHLGIPYEGSLNVHAKSAFRADKSDFKDVMTPEQIKRVGQIYKHEIHLMGY